MILLLNPFVSFPSCAAIANTSSETVTSTTASATTGFSHFYYESYCGTIITSSQMGAAKQITGLSLWQESGGFGGYTINNQRIAMAHCTETEFPSSSTTPTGGTYAAMSLSNILTLSDEIDVFDGSVTFADVDPDWSNEITFDTNFCYDGTSNVALFLLSYDSGSYPSNYNRFGRSTSADEGEYRMLYKNRDGSVIGQAGTRTLAVQSVKFYY